MDLSKYRNGPKIAINTEDLVLILEKFIKAGRLEFTLLSYDNKSSAVPNQLIVKYEDGQALLYTKDPESGDIKPIGTETDLYFNIFKENFLEVSDYRSKEDINPSMWFQIKTSNAGQSNYNKETIDFLYNEIESRMSSIKPFILQVNTDNQKHQMIPFVSTKSVFYDLSKIMSGQQIRNLEDVFKLMMEYMNKLRGDLSSMLDSLNKSIADTQGNIGDQNIRQDLNLEELEKEISKKDELLSQLQTEVQNLATNVEYRVRPYQFSLEGDENTAYPIVVRFTEGGSNVEGGYELFNGESYLTYEDPTRINKVVLGNGMDTTSTQYYSGNEEETYIFSQVILGNPVIPAIYDVRHVASGVWLLMLRGKQTYKIYSKYIEYIDVDISLGSKFEVDPVPNVPNVVINNNLTHKLVRDKTFTRRFDRSTLVVNELIIQDRYKLKVL